ncbi:MAG: YdeI/OmpD-associated family protein [Nocardioides sp.]
MSTQDDAELVEPETIEGWTAWLAEHHADRAGVWLVTAKRSTGRQPFDYEAGVCEALRYGWIDAVKKTLDDERAMQYYAPRRPTSGWARPNKIRIERLEREGLMEAPGRAVIDAAKANGTWTLLDDVEDLVVPSDLAAALDAHPGARAHWDDFPPSARKLILTWIVTAKQPTTREKRVAETAEKAAEGLRART